MAGNRYKKQSRKSKNDDPGSTGRVVTGVLDGSLITRHTTGQMIPFIMFLAGLALFLIFNTYYAEKQAREIEQLSREVMELRIKYVHTKSEYMYLTNRSELAQSLSIQGFIEPIDPPVIILDDTRRSGLWFRLPRINQ